MHLVMFDVDGTLVTGDGTDEVCYCEAVNDVLGIPQIDTDWSHYWNVTDSGITSELVEKHLHRRPEQEAIQAVRHAYVSKLRHQIGENPLSFRAVPGATELIADLRSMDGVCVCIATGGWRHAALLKLRLVGIPTDNIPVASSDDSDERRSIRAHACELACIQRHCEAFDSIVYVADHPGDLANSRRLGYGFVGIGSGNIAEELRCAGAIHVQPDFGNRDYFFKILRLTKGKP
ncbi:MAG: hypothetical protein A2147_07935 [Chloroflexi bacterium RBG_16_57_8]|nr:MAG: hypothetical protein A2147_07935 [Chloroflexi bacterium RBG_16_57_8]